MNIHHLTREFALSAVSDVEDERVRGGLYRLLDSPCLVFPETVADVVDRDPDVVLPILGAGFVTAEHGVVTLLRWDVDNGGAWVLSPEWEVLLYSLGELGLSADVVPAFVPDVPDVDMFVPVDEWEWFKPGMVVQVDGVAGFVLRAGGDGLLFADVAGLVHEVAVGSWARVRAAPLATRFVPAYTAGALPRTVVQYRVEAAGEVVEQGESLKQLRDRLVSAALLGDVRVRELAETLRGLTPIVRHVRELASAVHGVAYKQTRVTSTYLDDVSRARDAADSARDDLSKAQERLRVSVRRAVSNGSSRSAAAAAAGVSGGKVSGWTRGLPHSY